VLASGGKDSALALFRAIKQGYEVKHLVTMIPRREDSWMFHYPNIHLADLFAEAAGIPLVKGETSGAKEIELEDLRHVLEKLDIEGIVSGAVSSEYQKSRIERICKELNLFSITPLWQEDPLRLLQEIVSQNFEAIIVGVYAYGFTSSWLGKQIDQKTINDLLQLNSQYHVSPVGEGGEYETLVLDAPFFKKKIRLLKVEKIWEGQSGYLLVKSAELVDKPS
jgi:ABC transporter with metal-binding/Fe-S-binding domain ATP-binding protein